MPVLLARLRALGRRVRRAVLRRRRLLAAVCALVAVVAGLRTATAPPPATVAVTVAARDLGAGRVLRPGDLTIAEFAPGTVPSRLLRDPVGHELASPLPRGAPVTELGVLGPSLVQGRPDLVALPVRLPDTAMVELLRVGDEVDLVAADPQGGPAATVARAALVLALPSPPADAAADGLPGRVVVLGVRDAEVPALAAASLTQFLTVAWAR
jgi:hypothetical protein